MDPIFQLFKISLKVSIFVKAIQLTEQNTNRLFLWSIHLLIQPSDLWKTFRNNFLRSQRTLSIDGIRYRRSRHVTLRQVHNYIYWHTNKRNLESFECVHGHLYYFERSLDINFYNSKIGKCACFFTFRKQLRLVSLAQA